MRRHHRRIHRAVARSASQSSRAARASAALDKVLPARSVTRANPRSSGRSGWASSAILPQRAQALRQARDALIDEIAAQAAGHEVHVGARVAGARGERARQPLAKLVDALQPAVRTALAARASGRRSARDARARARRAARGNAARDARARQAARTTRRGPAPPVSAAAVGVGARTSAAKSISVVSVSWPTAEISGIGDLGGGAHDLFLVERPQILDRAAAARDDQQVGPRRRTTAKPRIAAAIFAAAPSPCTGTGQRMTCVGQRSSSR